jgi:hypothetical protein
MILYELVEAFGRNDLTFAADKQNFNTTTSMKCLTLNIPLSFAEFERASAVSRPVVAPGWQDIHLADDQQLCPHRRGGAHRPS